MGLVREPIDIDFYVDPRPLTKEEREKISRHIKAYKEKMARIQHRKAQAAKKRPVTAK